MKFRIYTLSKQQKVVLETNEAYEAKDKSSGEQLELETNELTEALAKVEEIKQANPSYTFDNLLDKDTDWDSVEMDTARKAAEESKDKK